MPNNFAASHTCFHNKIKDSVQHIEEQVEEMRSRRRIGAHGRGMVALFLLRTHMESD
jgi:hypothetical protein